MAFAPSRVLFPPHGDGSIQGRFYEADYNNLFEYSKAPELPFGTEYNSVVWCGPDGNSFRYAKVLKTVAYLVVDVDDRGEPVIDKWFLKSHKVYQSATFKYED